MKWIPLRRFLLGAGLLTLLAGALGGLARLGVDSGALGALGPWHGVVMVTGFAGLLISLERAVALERDWAYLGPVLALAGTLFIAAGRIEAAQAAWVAAALIHLAASLALAKRHWSLATGTMAAGAACWVVGNLAWARLGDPAASFLPWASFPLLIIAGERLELAQVLRAGKTAKALFAVLAGAALVFALAGHHGSPLAARLAALSWLGLAVWLLRCDDLLIRNLKLPGAARFTAASLFLAYLWLAAAAFLVLRWSRGDLLAWDSAVHAFFLGFMFSMILAHAPVIFPAVAGLKLRFHHGYPLALAALNLSVALRLGSWLGWPTDRRVGGLANAAALLLFLTANAWGLATAARQGRP